jgi:hypothetical protein
MLLRKSKNEAIPNDELLSCRLSETASIGCAQVHLANAKLQGSARNGHGGGAAAAIYETARRSQHARGAVRELQVVAAPYVTETNLGEGERRTR